MHSKKSGLKEGIELYEHQKHYINKILKDIERTNKKNFFISLPQGAGKTIIGLAILSELYNEGKVNNVLILLPRRVLVDQWVEKVQEMFYGFTLKKNPTLSKEKIAKIRGWLKHSNAIGIAMCAHSFKNYLKKGYFSERDFDLVIVDEAADIVVARDFIEGFRMSAYLSGLEKWRTLKIFLMPYQVKEKKLKEILHKFNDKISELIQEEVKEIEQVKYTIREPIIIDDPLINDFTEVLENEYRRIRRNVKRLLKKRGIDGYMENLETLLNPKVIERLRKIYNIETGMIKQIQTLISKYILIQHVKKWFLYSNREELARSILASQFEVKKWLSEEDKKLEKLVEIVKSLLEQDKKVYIFSQYIATAELISNFLSEKLNLSDGMTLITGEVEDQFVKLEDFQKEGKILVATPVFDKGTDIPKADAIIVFTPPLSKEGLFQVIGRIRGGEVIFLAYRGYEEEIINELVKSLKESFQGELE